jgi:hypothetical protein
MKKIKNFVSIILISFLFFSCASSKYYGNYKIVYQIDNKMRNPSKIDSNINTKKIIVLPFVDQRNEKISIVFSEPMSKYLAKLLIKKLAGKTFSFNINYLENIKFNDNYNLEEIIKNEQGIKAILWGNINSFDYKLEMKQSGSIYSGKKSIYNLKIKIDTDINTYFTNLKIIKTYKINCSKNYELIMCSNNVKDEDFLINRANLWCIENSNFSKFFVDFMQSLMDEKIEIVYNDLIQEKAMYNNQKMVVLPLIQYPEREKYISIQKINALEVQKNFFLVGGAIIGGILGSIIAVNMVFNANNDSKIGLGLGGFGAMLPGFSIGAVTGAGIGYIVGQLIVNSQIDSNLLYANVPKLKILLNFEI